jgi:hypothetical protein
VHPPNRLKLARSGSESLRHFRRNGPSEVSPIVSAVDPRDSMLAAVRPMRWGMSRLAKGRDLDPARVEFFTLLDGAC